MKRGINAVLVGSILMLPTFAASDEFSFGCDFEYPAYAIGSLHGQGNWSIGPDNVLVNIQRDYACSGEQAIEMMAPSGIATAYQPIKFLVNKGFRTSIAIAGSPLQERAVMSARYAGFSRIHAVDLKGNFVTIDYGVMQAPMYGYGPLKPFTYAAYMEVAVNNVLTNTSYVALEAKTFADWHHYSIEYSPVWNEVQFLVDGTSAGWVTLPTKPLLYVSGLSLQLEHNKTRYPKYKRTYFDELSIAN
jgi:hypothetical protein